MKACHLRHLPSTPELAGAAWCRALGGDELTLEQFELAAHAAVGGAGAAYDFVLVEATTESCELVLALARLLEPQGHCKLVLSVARSLPSDALALDRWRAVLAVADLVLCPQYGVCQDIRDKTGLVAYELAPPLLGLAECLSGGAPGECAARRTVTVVAKPGYSHRDLLREIGVLAYLATRVRHPIVMLAPDAAPGERDGLLSQSAFVYLPEPIEDGGVLAARCAQLGAILIANRRYDPAKLTFPYTTFDVRHERKRSLLFLWLYSSKDFAEFFREGARRSSVALTDENKSVQLLRRMQYRFPERSFLPPPSAGQSLLDQIRHRSGPGVVPCAQNECILVCLVRNGQEHIPSFLRHYRALRVRHFVFIDNASDDDTPRLLDGHADVTVYESSLLHKHYEREMRRLIIERFCRYRWCLNVDIDELFDYPMSDRLSLCRLLEYLRQRGATAMAGYMLDMYAKQTSFGEPRALDLKSAYPYYDISNITRSDYYAHQVNAFCDHNVLSADHVKCCFGGVRKTVFGSKAGEDYLLTKHPLIFLDGTLEPVTHPHYSNKAKVADVSCVLYHYKFTPAFKAKVEESRASQRYVKFAQGQYDSYGKQIGRGTSLVIDTPGTKRLRGVHELVEQGFLSVSPAFEDYVRGVAAGRTAGGPVARSEREALPRTSEPGRPLQGKSLPRKSLPGNSVVIATVLAVAIVIGAAIGGDASTDGAGVLRALLVGLFGILGLLSLLVLGSAAVYLLDGLWRRKRYVALLVALCLIALAASPPGVVLLSMFCGVVVATNALCYSHYALATLLLSFRRRWLDKPPEAPDQSTDLPRVSLVVPAKDEAAVLEETLRSLDKIDYPIGRLEVVVVDDGSTDNTRAIALRMAEQMRHRTIVVAHDFSEGKARRLNELASTLQSKFLLVLDADHWVDADVVVRMLRHFRGNPDVACVQIASLVRNAGTNCLTRALSMEYLFRCQGIYPGKPMGMFVGSGGMFRRSDLLAAGRFDAAMLTEDVELSYRLYKQGKRVVYDDSTRSYELATVDFRNFFNQRHRWMRGLWQAMLHHVGEAGTPPGFRRVRPHLVQFTLDGFGALCLSVLEMYFFLHLLGLTSFHLLVPALMLMLSCAFAFSVGFFRGGRLENVLYLPLVPLYMIAHCVPMAWALIDSYVLGKPVVWVKTERPSERPPGIRFRRA